MIRTEDQIDKVEAGSYAIVMKGNFELQLEQLINSHSKENDSNTPDFILAQYLIACLEAFNRASLAREKWYGKSLSINN
jgi:hypothetical protein